MIRIETFLLSFSEFPPPSHTAAASGLNQTVQAEKRKSMIESIVMKIFQSKMPDKTNSDESPSENRTSANLDISTSDKKNCHDEAEDNSIENAVAFADSLRNQK